MTHGDIRISVLFASVCVTALGGAPSFAQTPVSGGSSQLEEIVVTAQRREEGLQDVPISVTALSAQKLEAKQVLDVEDLNKAVPGYSARQTLSPLELTMSIRGVAQLLPSIGSDPTIGMYVDGVYNVLNAGSNLGMIDMERVEVLKGPQGTLFGRNTIGGAISVTTAKPTDEFGGYLQARVGRFDTRTVTGVINGALAPGVIAARLVYQHDENSGSGHNFTTGGGTDTLNRDYVRGTVKVTPSENWEILAQGFYVDANGDPTATRLVYADPAFSLAPGFLPPNAVLFPALNGNPGDSLVNYVRRGGFWDSYGNVSGYWMRQYGGVGTITGQINEAVTVKSITAYSKTRYNTIADLDGTPYPYLDFASYPINLKQFSEEFQIYGDALDNRLSWIAGLYYFEAKGSQITRFVAFAPLVVGHSRNGPVINKKSSSAFAQVTYEIVPKVRLTAGVRYVVDKRSALYRDHRAAGQTPTGGLDGDVPPGTFISCNLANAAGSPDPAACVFSDSVKYDYIPWTVGVDYQPNEDTLLYAKISKGYRSGAFDNNGPQGVAGNTAANAGAVALFGPVEPERLISYEGGMKLDLLDRRLRVNAAAYWSKYDNIQLFENSTVPGCVACNPISVLRNSGSAEIWGGELEVTALLGDLILDGQVGYTHPKYVSGANLGTPVISVPKLNYSISANYPIEMSAGTLTLDAAYSYQGKVVLYSLAATSPAFYADFIKQEGYGLLDARGSFQFRNAPITIAVYGQNLANKKYITSATTFGPPQGVALQFPGQRRTYGVELKYEF